MSFLLVGYWPTGRPWDQRGKGQFELIYSSLYKASCRGPAVYNA